LAAVGAGAVERPLKLRLPKAPAKVRLEEVVLPQVRAPAVVPVPVVSARDAVQVEVKDPVVAANPSLRACTALF
jgi:hypothetical protein